MRNLNPKTVRRLEGWIHCELSHPVREGEGRNNQMIKLSPRMLELGWSEDVIFETFKKVYNLQDDLSKDNELRRVVANARKYAKNCTTARSRAEWEDVARRLASLRRDARRELPNILNRFSWSANSLKSNIPARNQREAFIKTLFGMDEIMWSGDKRHTGKPHHRRHFRPAKDWISDSADVWPFISQCTFQAGVFSRCNQNIAKKKYLVVESDLLTHDQILAIFCWLHHE